MNEQDKKENLEIISDRWKFDKYCPNCGLKTSQESNLSWEFECRLCGMVFKIKRLSDKD